MGRIIRPLLRLLRGYVQIVRFSATGEARLIMGIWNRRAWIIGGAIASAIVVAGLNIWGSCLGFVEHPVASRVMVGVATLILLGFLYPVHLLLKGLAAWLKLNIDLVEKPIVEWGLTAGKDILLALLKGAGLAIEDIKLGKLSLVDQETMQKKVASTRQILIAAALVQAVLFLIPDVWTLFPAFLVMLIIFSLVLQIKEFEWDPTAGRLLVYRFTLILGSAGIIAALGWLFGEKIMQLLVGGAVVVGLATGAQFGATTGVLICLILALSVAIGGVVVVWRLFRRIARADARPIDQRIEAKKKENELASLEKKKVGWFRPVLVLVILAGLVMSVIRYREDVGQWLNVYEPEQSEHQHTSSAASQPAHGQQASTPAPAVRAATAPASTTRVAWVEQNGAANCPQLMARPNWRRMHDPRAACRLEANRSRFAWMGTGGQ